MLKNNAYVYCKQLLHNFDTSISVVLFLGKRWSSQDVNVFTNAINEKAINRYAYKVQH